MVKPILIARRSLAYLRQPEADAGAPRPALPYRVSFGSCLSVAYWQEGQGVPGEGATCGPSPPKRCYPVIYRSILILRFALFDVFYPLPPAKSPYRACQPSPARRALKFCLLCLQSSFGSCMPLLLCPGNPSGPWWCLPFPQIAPRLPLSGALASCPSWPGCAS